MFGNETVAWPGYLATVFAGVFWGSNFVPVKTYDAGDGLFFQWILCSGIFVLGFIVYVARGFPPFQPFTMLGGVLWTIGNLMSVPIINMIGLSLGMLLWSTSALVVGWATGTFGLFGVKKSPVETIWMNYLGAGLAVLSTICFGFITPSSSVAKKENGHLDVDEITPFTNNNRIITSTEDEIANLIVNSDTSFSIEKKEENVFEVLTNSCSPNLKRFLGFFLSVVSGLFYGSDFTPPQYTMAHCTNNCSQNGLDYVYSHFCGIYLSSTFFFLLYCAFLILIKREIYAPKEIILPAFLSGLMWGTAQTLSFISISALSMSISFPMMSTFPGIVASIWGIFVFKEISGMKNYIIFSVAFLLVISAALLVAFSKGQE